jgi:hypothetical protein
MIQREIKNLFYVHYAFIEVLRFFRKLNISGTLSTLSVPTLSLRIFWYGELGVYCSI